MQKSYECQLATHIGPESCGAARKSSVEALTGERAGRVFSRVRRSLRDADALAANLDDRDVSRGFGTGTLSRRARQIILRHVDVSPLKETFGFTCAPSRRTKPGNPEARPIDVHLVYARIPHVRMQLRST
jgi:hypothetical protein